MGPVPGQLSVAAEESAVRRCPAGSPSLSSIRVSRAARDPQITGDFFSIDLKGGPLSPLHPCRLHRKRQHPGQLGRLGLSLVMCRVAIARLGLAWEDLRVNFGPRPSNARLGDVIPGQAAWFRPLLSSRPLSMSLRVCVHRSVPTRLGELTRFGRTRKERPVIGSTLRGPIPHYASDAIDVALR